MAALQTICENRFRNFGLGCAGFERIERSEQCNHSLRALEATIARGREVAVLRKQPKSLENPARPIEAGEPDEFEDEPDRAALKARARDVEPD